jgi:hypothetical protein
MGGGVMGKFPPLQLLAALVWAWHIAGNPISDK